MAGLLMNWEEASESPSFRDSPFGLPSDGPCAGNGFMRVSYIAVTADAGEHIAARLGGKDGVDVIGMAMQAGALRDATITRLDADGIGEVFQRKR